MLMKRSGPVFVILEGKKYAAENPRWGWFILGLVIGAVTAFAALWILAVLKNHCCADCKADSKMDVLLTTKGPSHSRMFVKEGSDVMLPCFLRNQDLTSKVFEWKKGDQTVFLYDEAKIENGGLLGQDQQFKGRVSHFQSELQEGNASIKMRNVKVEDSGNYSCYFTSLDPPQIFWVELVVGGSNGRIPNSSPSIV